MFVYFCDLATIIFILLNLVTYLQLVVEVSLSMQMTTKNNPLYGAGVDYWNDLLPSKIAL